MNKRLFFLTVILILFSGYNLFAYNYVNFQARHIQGLARWYYLEFNEFETKVTVDGLFYETTLTMKVRLGKIKTWDGVDNYPTNGNYEFTWNFYLPEKSIITDCKLWDDEKNKFISAQMVDLSTAEENYNKNNTSYQQLLMREYRERQWDGSLNNFLELKLTPVKHDEYKKIQIKYLCPCDQFWNVRRFRIDTKSFYNPYLYRENGNPIYPNNDNPAKFKLIDKNNPEASPIKISGFDVNWSKIDGYWQYESRSWGTNSILGFPEETVNGEYLKTFDDGKNKFYQYSILPNITVDDTPGRHIIIAIDLVENTSYVLHNIMKSLQYSLTSKDSVAFIVSDFNPYWLDDKFNQKTDVLIEMKIDEAISHEPKLNTLPFILRSAVNRFNQIKKPGEIWLISDDYNHGKTSKKVMEIVNQTVFASENEIKFRILDANFDYQQYWINNKYYRGNQYLYENLFRLTRGSFEELWSSEPYNFNWPDIALDVFAPTVSIVEIDPIPQNGFSYSRVDLNNGRKSFNIASRYYQIGLYDGNTPFDLLYFGSYNDTLYRKTFNVEETEIKNECDIFAKTYWFTHYIRDHLLNQPQTYETIKYIEEIALENNIITPYSGFLIPGTDNYIGFKALTLDDTLSPIETLTMIEKNPEVPNTYSISAYPNPFNPSTTITIQMSNITNENFTVGIYNILGQKVISYNSNSNNKYKNTIVWNGKNQYGEDVGSGTYIVRYISGQHIQSMKLLLIR